MRWHIITGSKGGSGKSLMALMLTQYSRLEGEVLVVDLNGMNADLSRLLNCPEHQRLSFSNPPKPHGPLNLGDFQVEKPRDRGYLLAWPENPFTPLNLKDFQLFFMDLRDRVIPAIQQKFSPRIDTLIIDTNYHFCSIFPTVQRDYALAPWSFFGKGGGDTLYLWFLWTYRQLKVLFEAHNDLRHPNFQAVTMLRERSTLIEANLGHPDPSGQNHSPFVHVFNPLSMGQVIATLQGNNFGSWFKFGKQHTTLRSLKTLFELSTGKTVGFNTLLSTLRVLREDLRKQKQWTSTYELYFSLFQQYAAQQQKNNLGCPRNLLPIYLYERQLAGYTETDYEDLLTDLGKSELYTQNFQPACTRLLAS